MRRESVVAVRYYFAVVDPHTPFHLSLLYVKKSFAGAPLLHVSFRVVHIVSPGVHMQ